MPLQSFVQGNAKCPPAMLCRPALVLQCNMFPVRRQNVHSVSSLLLRQEWQDIFQQTQRKHSASFLLPLLPLVVWHGPCVLPAKGIQLYAGTTLFASPI